MRNILKTIVVGLAILSPVHAYAQWGFISEVTKPEEGIICDADITRDTKYKANQTEVVVVERIDKNTVKLGMGTRLQLALVPNAKGEMVALMLLGYPGSKVTLQPGTSVEWNKMTLKPGEGKAVTFVIGERDGKVILEKISRGVLQSERKGEGTSGKKGVLRSTDKGVVEKIEY